MARRHGPDSPGECRALPARANRHPAAASYIRARGDHTFRTFKIGVLRVVEVRSPRSLRSTASFDAFGLPPTI